MIKKEELRIGNILNYTTSENEIYKTKLDWQDLKWISEDQKGFNLVHDPIPLTEEWLLKFGASKYGLSYEYDRFFLNWSLFNFSSSFSALASFSLFCLSSISNLCILIFYFLVIKSFTY